MKIYLVGGAVRDSLLKIPVKDKDWVIVGGTEELLLKKKYQQVGKDFPVFLHPKTHEEYALARKERKSGRGYTGFHVDVSKNITLEEDLTRRDLTINAIAQDQDGNYIDPCQGQKDIKSRIIRHISTSFKEDPLRVLRTARFAASLIHLGFTIAKETMKMMCMIVENKELSYLTVNRVWSETEKALKTSHPHVYFQTLNECQALKYLFPEIYFLYYNPVYCSCNLFNKNFIFMQLARLSLLNTKIDIRLSYILQFLSCKNFYNSLSITFYNTHSALVAFNFCKRFNIPTCISEFVVLSTGFYCFLNTILHQSSEKIVKFLYKIDAWRKPDRVKKLSFLRYFNNIQNDKIFLKSRCFLYQAFLVVKDISVQSILNKGFRGHQIKKEFIRIRIKKLELWRMNNFKKKYNIYNYNISG